MLPDIYIYNPSSGLADGSVSPAKLASTVYGLVGEIQPLGTVSAGSSVRLASADHVHPTTGLALLGSANTFTVGGHTITAEAIGVVPLTLTGASGQTADLLSAGGGIARITNTGFLHGRGLRIKNGTATTSGVQVSIEPEGTTVVGANIIGASGQSADLQRWSTYNAGNANGTTASLVDSAGRFVVNSVGTGGNSPNGVAWLLAQPSSSIGSSLVQVNRGAASQLADLFQYQTSSGTVLGGRNALAQTWSGSTSPLVVQVGGAPTAAAYGSPTASRMRVTLTSAPGVAVGDLITVANITGATGGNPNGTFLVTAVSNTTTFWVEYDPGTAVTGTLAVSGTTTVSAAAQASFTARSAGTLGLVVRAAASPQADILQVQDSTGTSQFKIDNSGNPVLNSSRALYANTLNNISTGNNAQILLASGGATVQTAIAGNVGLVVKNSNATPTVDLQQWVSTSTTVAKMSNAGKLTATIDGGTA